jgi:sterol desaturase/sphingolipid hydroxylase (fatty acid hydroxylase superfamily)
MKKIGRLDRPDNFGSAQIFSNPFLERISRTHISIPITLFLAISAVSLFYGVTATSIPFGFGLAVAVLGIVAFTFVEYMMHKHFFHMEPDTPIKDKLQYGFLVGYAGYLGVHYVVHVYNPPKNFLKVLWVHHAIHHYKDPDSAFGVSSPLWDYLLGTLPKKE